MNLEKCAECGKKADDSFGLVECSNPECEFGHGVNLTPEMWNHVQAAIRTVQELTETWQPTPAMVNALPEKVREYVAALETRCDPAGDVQALTLANDQIAAMGVLMGIWRGRAKAADRRIESMEIERERLKAEIGTLFRKLSFAESMADVVRIVMELIPDPLGLAPGPAKASVLFEQIFMMSQEAAAILNDGMTQVRNRSEALDVLQNAAIVIDKIKKKIPSVTPGPANAPAPCPDTRQDDRVQTGPLGACLVCMGHHEGKICPAIELSGIATAADVSCSGLDFKGFCVSERGGPCVYCGRVFNDPAKRIADALASQTVKVNFDRHLKELAVLDAAVAFEAWAVANVGATSDWPADFRADNDRTADELAGLLTALSRACKIYKGTI